MHNTPNAHDSKTYVLVDPTSPDGESGLRLLDESDTHVSVVVLLTGRMSAALKAFAVGADLDLPTAGWAYLEQVARRISADDRIVETVLGNGPNPAQELLYLVANNPSTRVLVPSSLQRVDIAAHRQLVDALGAHVQAPELAGSV